MNPSPTLSVEVGLQHEQIRQLKAENERLERKLAFYEMHNDALGLQAEAHVFELVRGRVAGDGKCDVVTRSGTRLEIKFSSVRGRKGKGLCRWAWYKVIGSKKYERLILIGNPETPHRSSYKAPKARFVFFDVPYHEVRGLSTKYRHSYRISLNANPDVNEKTTEFFRKYEVTEGDLEARYGRSASEHALYHPLSSFIGG